MLERIGEAFEAIGRGHDRVHKAWEQYNPDLYSAADAAYILGRRTNADREYLYGTPELLNPVFNKDRAKIWSLPPEVLETVEGIVKDSGHVHFLPFVLGTYEMNSRTMRMNDACLSDPWMAYLIATGGLEGFAMPFLRGLYYAGRSSWWRHESIHVRHHHQMAYFLGAKDERKQQFNDWKWNSRLEEAAFTIHEAGIEELLTRWQALRESRGLREKAVSILSLLFYLEYAPFTGIRNMFIDGKEKTLDLLQDGRVRIPAKIAATLGIALIPRYLDDQTHFIEALGNAATQFLQVVTDKQVEGVIRRGHVYVVIAALAALFSTKEKGAFAKREVDGQHLTTTEYKFPYAYSPITSIARSVGFLHYLHNVWDQIPNYRRVESLKQIDHIRREVDGRVAARMGSRQHQFTMQVVEDALGPVKGARRSEFPREVYLKGMFTPALYLRLRELYG